MCSLILYVLTFLYICSFIDRTLCFCTYSWMYWTNQKALEAKYQIHQLLIFNNHFILVGVDSEPITGTTGVKEELVVL